MMKKFNQQEYIKKYNKEHYKTFKVDLKIEEYNELEKILNKNKLTKAQFLRDAILNYEICKAIKESALRYEESKKK